MTSDKEVSHTEERNIASATSKLSEAQEKKVRKQLQDSIEEKMEGERTRLQKEVTKKLESKLSDLQQEIDAISNRVAGTALRRRRHSSARSSSCRRTRPAR